MIGKKLVIEKYKTFDIHVLKVKPKFYRYVVIKDKQVLADYVAYARNKQELVEKISQQISNTNNNKTNLVIAFRNMNQKVLYDKELSGQISDGNWENSRPFNHWEIMTDAEIIVDPNNLGPNFTPKRKYNFNDPELFNDVKNRMLFHVRAYNVLGKTLERDILEWDEINTYLSDLKRYAKEEEERYKKITGGENVMIRGEKFNVFLVDNDYAYATLFNNFLNYQYRVNGGREITIEDLPQMRKKYKIYKIKRTSTEKIINPSMFWNEKLILVTEKLNASTNEEAIKVLTKIKNYPYSEADLHKDLIDMSNIVNNKRRR